MKSHPVPQPTPTPLRRDQPPRQAFSLIETALALGIVAFAFVGLMGLLPAGLGTFRTAIDTTVSAQIVQRIVSDAEQADFDALTADTASSNPNYYVLKTRYFDDQGSEVLTTGGGSPTSAEQVRILYHVRVRGSQPGSPDTALTGTGNFTSLPNSIPGGRFHPRDSTFLTIQIANNPSSKTLKVDAQQLWDAVDAKKTGVSITTQSAVVTRNGPKKTP